MAKPHPFDALIEHTARIFAAQLSTRLPSTGQVTVRAKAPLARTAKLGKPSAPAKRKRSSWLKGKTLDMNCRVAGCKNKSGGPRHGFMCAEHQKLPKKEQQAARDAYKAKKA